MIILSAFFLLASLAWGQSYSSLYSFQWVDGDSPAGMVTLDKHNHIYGTVPNSDEDNLPGAVFQLLSTGCQWMDNIVYDFSGGSDGGSPGGRLIVDNAGNIYGTAYTGGAYGKGGIFQLSGSGSTSTENSTWTETVLYSFTGNADGLGPLGLTADNKGNLYGVADGGNLTGPCASLNPAGCGVVFELVKGKTGWTFKVLNTFDGANGAYPGVPVVLDSAGNIYGTTQFGGNYTGPSSCTTFGCGTVYKLAKPKTTTAPWQQTVLYSFAGGTDGYSPSGVSLDTSGNLYGGTGSGGSHSLGNIYKLSPSKRGYSLKNIFNFDGTNGSYPSLSAIDSAGNIYGTTYDGGRYGGGTVFELSAGTWKHTDLHDFGNEMDGEAPSGGLTMDSEGNFYGVTEGGGDGGGYGTVYEITPAGASKRPLPACAGTTDKN
jgi:uncharacterized repeat protein (TIGR03803 family)